MSKLEKWNFNFFHFSDFYFLFRSCIIYCLVQSTYFWDTLYRPDPLYTYYDDSIIILKFRLIYSQSTRLLFILNHNETNLLPKYSRDSKVYILEQCRSHHHLRDLRGRRLDKSQAEKVLICFKFIVSPLFSVHSQLCIPSTLNTDLILWHAQWIVTEVRY